MNIVGVVSLGCSKNRVDSEKMMAILTQNGYTITNRPQDADIIVVNTCGFIEPAKEESINTIFEMASYKDAAKCKILVVTGCLSERYRDELIAEMPEIDVITGVSEYETLPELLKEKGAKPAKQGNCSRISAGRVISTPSHYAYLRIADGCDNRCSYCAIPGIRGHYRSVPMQDILDEARALVISGVKELIVIAQDTTRYGTDISGKRELPNLLKALAETDVEWIRLLYTYSDDIDDQLLDAMASSEKILKYLDIPVQHVDDEIISKMHRRGTREKLCGLMEKIRAKDSRFVLRTSFIVGFPGETEEQFESLLEFVKTHPFDRAGVFRYSPEDGTPAMDFSDQIPVEVAQKRLERLMEAQREVSQKLLSSRVGETCRVLVEGFDENSGMRYGRSYAEAPEIDGVVFLRDDDPNASTNIVIGDFVEAKIVQALEHDLIAVLV